MKKLFMACLVLVMYASVLPTSAQQRGETGQRTGATAVSVADVSEQVHTISVGGRLQPKNRVVHKTFNEGIIRSVAVDEGDQVAAGEKLFSIGRKDDLDKSYEPFVVTSRISGIVSEVLVQTDDEVENGESAIIVLGNGGLILKTHITDKDASKLQLGQEVTATNIEEDNIQGVLDYRSREPDYDTGLYTLTFHFPEMEQRYIGDFVIINLPVDRESGIFVKRDVITRRYGAYYLWIVNEEQELEAREVVLGPVYGDMVKISSGLSAGERYLGRLTGREKEGSTVNASGS